MFKRTWTYFKETYPLFSRLLLGFVIFLEIYFLVLLNFGQTTFKLSIQELIGGFTVFAFLMFLRIADDFKDYETDKILFPERTLPSGRVKKSDLAIALTVVTLITFAINIAFMNNLPFFFFLYFYGFMMSMWFFQKHKIQKSLPLALVTHNPVQMVMNIYIISFTVIKYDLAWFKLHVILAAFTLYFPALIWEVGRKIRAPEDETEYVTYSKLFGVKKSIRFIFALTWIDVITNIVLVWNLNHIAVILIIINVLIMSWRFIEFVKDPKRFPIIRSIERYTLILESLMLLTVAAYLIWGQVKLW